MSPIASHSPTHPIPEGHAAARRDPRVRGSARSLLLLLGLPIALATFVGAAGAEVPAAPAPPGHEVSGPARHEGVAPVASIGIDDLLSLPPEHGRRSEAQIADAAIADAITHRRSEPAAGPVSGFRARSRDLFQSEHPVEIGEQEMLLRLRLRAKSRETMSVELRF